MFLVSLYYFFFNDTATTEIYTLSLHDALPIFAEVRELVEHEDAAVEADPALERALLDVRDHVVEAGEPGRHPRSEEHTSELQSRLHLVCRLLLEKKKKKNNQETIPQNDISYVQ